MTENLDPSNQPQQMHFTEQSPQSPEAVGNITLSSLTTGVMERFGDDVKHFRDGGSTLVLTSGEAAGPQVAVEMLRDAEGGSLVSISGMDTTRDYFSDGDQVYRLDREGDQHMSRPKLIERADRVPVEAEELAGLFDRLQAEDLKVDEAWKGYRLRSQVN